MAKPTTFTQAQVEATRAALADLPDLSRDKIGKADVLVSLKEQIATLAKDKGYTVSEIKSALAGLGVSVTTRDIDELIATKKKRIARKIENPSAAN